MERKLIATSTEPDLLFEAFLAHLKKAAMSSIVIEAATRVYKNVLRQDVFLKSAKNYLTHPIRVAANYASMLETVEADDVVLAEATDEVWVLARAHTDLGAPEAARPLRAWLDRPGRVPDPLPDRRRRQSLG